MSAPTLWQIVRYFLSLGATGFGGPVALAHYMRRDLVEKRGWLDEAAYERGLAIATACPGPMAYQLGVYCGYIMHGIPGALAVAVAFALPPFIIVTVIAALYERFAGAGIVRGLFYGIGPVVVALILRASLNLGRKTLKRDYAAWSLALIACAVTIALRRDAIGLISPGPVVITATFVGYAVDGFAGAVAAAPGSSCRPSSSPSSQHRCSCATAAIRGSRVSCAA